MRVTRLATALLLVGSLLVLHAEAEANGSGTGSDSAAHAIAALRLATMCAAWRRLGGVRIEGTRAGDGVQGRFSMRLDPQSGKWIEDWRSGNLSRGNGYDGGAPWERDFSATIHVMNGSLARANAASLAWLRSEGWCDPASATYRAAGAEIVARPHGGAPIMLDIDRSTHLLDRAVLQYDENHEIYEFSDWRTVAGGAAAPFGVRIVDPEDSEQETDTIRDVSPQLHFRAATFLPPKTAEHLRLPPNQTSVTIPYVDDGNKPIVEVRINGKGPFPFVIDTGGHFILAESTARELGLSGRGSFSSANAGTVRKAGFTRVAQLQIGGAIVRDLVAKINPYGYAKLERGPRPPKAGWLGLELFERFAVTFDPVNHRMTLRPLTLPRSTPPGTRLPLIFDEDSPAIGCRIAGKPGVCMLDTGNAGPTVVVQQWAARSGLARHFATAGVNAGDGRVSRTTVALGPFIRPFALAWYTPPSDGNPDSFVVEAAIVSEALIEGFVTTFDYGRGAVWLQPAAAYVAEAFNRSGTLASRRPDGTFVVRYVIAGSPAAKAGLRDGDVILRVVGAPAARFSGADFSRANASRAHSITFTIARGGESPRTVTLPLTTLLPASR
jgi:hypothetical protein